MSSETFPNSKARSRVRLFVILVLLGIVGVIFVQANQRLRSNRLSTATTADLEKDLKQNPEDKQLMFRVAYKQVRDGKHKEALAIMQRLVQLEPQSTINWYGLARCAAGAGQAQLAIDAYKRVVALDPKQTKAQISLGEIYAAAGLITDALREYDAANDKLEAARYGALWPKCLVKKGRDEEAWEVLMTSIQRNPTQDEGYIILADLGLRLKRQNEAEIWLQRRLKMTSVYPVADVRRALARFLLAQPDSPDSLETAEVVLRVLISHVGNDEKTGALMGQVLLARGKSKEAKTFVEAGLKRDPDHRDSLRVLAEIYTKLGQPDKADQMRSRLALLEKKEGELPALRRAVEAAPDDVNARLRLAEALDREEQFGEATEECEAILAKNPTDTKAAALRDQYRQKALDKLTRTSGFTQSAGDLPSGTGPQQE